MAKELKQVEKVNRSEYLARVAKRIGVSRRVVIEVYNGMVEEFIVIMREERQLLLTGFGNFFIQKHKGHPVQFSGGSDVVDDYNVLKFAPSNILKKRVRNDESED